MSKKTLTFCEGFFALSRDEGIHLLPDPADTFIHR